MNILSNISIKGKLTLIFTIEAIFIGLIGLTGSITDTSKTLMLIISITAISFTLFIGRILYKDICKAIKELELFGEMVTNCDSPYQLEIIRKDEFRKTQEILYQAHKRIKKLILSISDVIEMMNASAMDISKEMIELSSVVSDVNGTVSVITESMGETNISIENIGSSLHMLSAKAITEKNNSGEQKKRAIKAHKDSQNAISQSNEILLEKKEKMMKAIEGGKVGQDVQKMIDLIVDLTRQTNLLSLNAAIEAARAGEHGRGFAVVATEVGELAKQSGAAIENVQQTIGKVHIAFQNSVEAGTDIMSFLEEVQQKLRDCGKVAGDYFNDAEAFSISSEDMNEVLSQVSGTMQGLKETAENSGKKVDKIKESMDTTIVGMGHAVAVAKKQGELIDNMRKIVSEFIIL